jgi:hypothetical protein
MPLLPSVPAGQYRILSTSHTNGYSQALKILVLVLVAAIGIRFAVVKVTRRGRMSPTSVATLVHSQEKDIKSHQAPSEDDRRQNDIRQPQDHQQLEFKPIYPWISPPQALPGPYDPRLYPLPTIRRHSHDPSAQRPEQNTTVSFARRVSTNHIPTQQRTLHGSVTTSTRGWRRSQWVVSGA